MKQKKTFLILALLAFGPTAWAQNYNVWDGSSKTRPTYYSSYGGCSEVVVINTAAELAYAQIHWDDDSGDGVSKDYYEHNYYLNADLDLTAANWTPMGSARYKGTFYGNGHTIRIKIDDSSISSNYRGLFETIGGDGTVKNLHVDGKIKVGNARIVGAIAGNNYGTIENCWVSADVESSHYSSYDADLGGITGWNESGGTVKFCCMTGNVTNTGGNYGVGGIAGSNDGTIEHCTFYGSVSVNHSQDSKYVGDQDGTVDDLYDTYYDVHYNYASGYSMYSYAYKYPYSFIYTIPYAVQANAHGENNVPGTRHGETVTLTKTASQLTTFTIKDANGNDVSFSGNINNGSVTFTMPSRDVTITAIADKWTNAGNYSTEFTHTDGNTIYIDSEADLALIAVNVNAGNDYVGKTFILSCDLNLVGKDWTPIGTTDRPFRGNFDGNNHTISNLTVNNPSGDYNGLFGYVTGVILEPGGNDPGCDYIRNFVVKNANVRGRNYTGGVAGHVLGKLIFENVILDGATVEGADYTSGFIGFAEGIQIWLASMDAYSPLDVQNCLFINGSVTANNAAHIYDSYNHPRSSFVMFGEISTHSFFTSCYFNNVVYNGAAAQEDYYNVQAYPVIVNAPSNINCEFLFAPIYVPGQAVPDNYVSAAGIDYNGNYYIPGTTPFRLSYNDYQYRVTSVKINGVEVGTNIGEYVLNAGGSPIDSYTVTVEYEPGLTGSGTEDNPYLITSTELWDWFAFTVSQGRNYSGKFVRLDADIDISTTVGLRGDKPFSGTFLGNRHTITANISSTTTGTGVNEQGVAPFHYINGATIKDLTVAGTIASASYHTSGLVGFADGTNLIENCIVTATLNISSDYAGGLVGHGRTSTTTIRGCVFAGTINGVDGNRENIGGIWGWSDSGTPTLEDCMEAGTYTNIASMHPMGLQKAAGAITNCYYVTPQIGEPSNACTVSGAKQAYVFTTAPANLGELVKDYGTIKVYQNGILYNGTYYMAFVTITLADNSDNSTTISNADGYLADVTLQGRTLYKDGAWNTLCLPFSVDNFTGTPLEGATVKTLESTDFSGGTLTMNFSDDLTSIEAGKPYIVKWAEGTDIVNPVFNGIIISNVTANAETDYADFVGTYSPVGIYTADRTNLFLGSANMLRYPTNPNYTVNACRGYFQLKNGLTASENASQVSGNEVKAFVLNFGDGETTGIESLTPNPSPNGEGSEYWYSIDGRRLQGEPTQKGVYIKNGKKITK